MIFFPVLQLMLSPTPGLLSEPSTSLEFLRHTGKHWGKPHGGPSDDLGLIGFFKALGFSLLFFLLCNNAVLNFLEHMEFCHLVCILDGIHSENFSEFCKSAEAWGEALLHGANLLLQKQHGTGTRWEEVGAEIHYPRLWVLVGPNDWKKNCI